jgi:hypothetical protein
MEYYHKTNFFQFSLGNSPSRVLPVPLFPGIFVAIITGMTEKFYLTMLSELNVTKIQFTNGILSQNLI